MPNPYVNKVTVNNVTIIDLTSDTVTADTLMQGYTAHDKSGALITGTATGGGTGGVIQDQDGYLVLDDDTPTPTPRGLEYETGTWTPSEDVADHTISFANTHTVAPAFYEIFDNGSYNNATNTSLVVTYNNWHQMIGCAVYPSTTSTRYGEVRYQYRANSDSSISSSVVTLTQPYTYSSDSSNVYPRFWATETGIRAYCGASDRYWRSGRTYKWIAVWAPTS